MDLHRIGFKFFLEDTAPVAATEVIPVFHRWIQQKAVEGLLIDVADYSHVPDGPGVLLVAHEGNYALDRARNGPGLVYYRKRPLNGDPNERFARIALTTLLASRQLEEDPAFQGRLRFRTDVFEAFANDRLEAPNTDEAARRFEIPVRALAERLWNDSDVTIEREPDRKERLSLTVRGRGEPSLRTLLERLSP